MICLLPQFYQDTPCCGKLSATTPQLPIYSTLYSPILSPPSQNNTRKNQNKQKTNKTKITNKTPK